MEYTHTQIGYLMIVVVGAGIFLLCNFFYLHGYQPVFIAVFIVLVVCLFLFAVLNVRVDSEEIKIRFGIGLIRKNFPLRDIESHSIVKNPWYYGWGIRRTPHGWLYNVSGFRAVELRMKDGKGYRIGTNDPSGLYNAIETVLSGKKV